MCPGETLPNGTLPNGCSATSSSSDEDDHTGMIVGVVIGAIVLLVFVVALTFWGTPRKSTEANMAKTSAVEGTVV